MFADFNELEFNTVYAEREDEFDVVCGISRPYAQWLRIT